MLLKYGVICVKHGAQKPSLVQITLGSIAAQGLLEPNLLLNNNLTFIASGPTGLTDA